NNTWLDNLSTLYQEYIGFLLIRSDNTHTKIALDIHPWLVENHSWPAEKEISQNEVNGIFSGLRSAISELDTIAENISSFEELMPLDLLMDIDYDDGTSLRLALSIEKGILGVLNGTWEDRPSNYNGTGWIFIPPEHNYTDSIFLKIANIELFLSVLQQLEEFILAIFPAPPSHFDSIGEELAYDLLRKINLSWLSSFWSRDNEWVNTNLTSYYQEYVEGVFFDVPIDQPIHKMAIVRSSVQVKQIPHGEVDVFFEDILSAINESNSVAKDIDGLDKLTSIDFSVDISFGDYTSVSLVISIEQGILGYISGSWEYDEAIFINSTSGYRIYTRNYSFEELTFIEISDINMVLSAISELETIIQSVFPA
ncbi:MAG: hypothetical protein ACFFCZ_31590, partial [Promethearchaeota archaeon]